MLPIEDDEMFLNREILLLFLGAGHAGQGTDDDDVDKILATSGVVVVVVVVVESSPRSLIVSSLTVIGATELLVLPPLLKVMRLATLCGEVLGVGGSRGDCWEE